MLETLARQLEFLELPFSEELESTKWRLPSLSCGVMDCFWELGEAVEMHKSWEAGDGKGG